eukprot:7575618-Pyramimonas_sp.AAC.1
MSMLTHCAFVKHMLGLPVRDASNLVFRWTQDGPKRVSATHERGPRGVAGPSRRLRGGYRMRPRQPKRARKLGRTAPRQRGFLERLKTCHDVPVGLWERPRGGGPYR